MDEVDNKENIIKLRLKIVNLKQRKTENIIKFIVTANVLAKKISDFQINIAIAVT